MKTLIASALVATAALTGAASAATPTAFPAQKQIEMLIPDADLSGLTDAQIVSVAQNIAAVDSAAGKVSSGKALIKAFQNN